MKKFIVLSIAVCLMLTGCMSWMDGYYHSSQPYEIASPGDDGDVPAAATYNELRAQLCRLVEQGSESGIIFVDDYPESRVDLDSRLAAAYVQQNFPLGVYAVTDMTLERGTSGGRAALAVTVSYRYSRSELRQIRRIDTMDQVHSVISESLNQCITRVTMLVEQYKETDLVQFVADYAEEHPEYVMELPQTTVSVYPQTGSQRVVEIQFTYQTSRDVLRSMQSQVASVMNTAVSAARDFSEEQEQLDSLCDFLQTRMQQVQTSITPTYSLLTYGVGDSRAVAVAFAALCGRMGLECSVVSGTWEGESRFWNIVRIGELYHHVDVLRMLPGAERYLGDSEMMGYVWDYSAYPACDKMPVVAVVPENPPTEHSADPEDDPEETSDPTEETIPENFEEM